MIPSGPAARRVPSSSATAVGLAAAAWRRSPATRAGTGTTANRVTPRPYIPIAPGAPSIDRRGSPARPAGGETRPPPPPAPPPPPLPPVGAPGGPGGGGEGGAAG